MVADKEPTASQINLIAFAARDGETTPEEARALLEMFYKQAIDGKRIHPRLLEFVAESFGRFLGHKFFYGPDERDADTLDSAFGLVPPRAKGKRGRPPANRRLGEQRRIAIAAMVLRSRLAGLPHQDALEEAAAAAELDMVAAGHAWRDHWHDAMAAVGIEREADQTPWTDDERHILEAIQHYRRKRQGAAARAQNIKDAAAQEKARKNPA